MQYSVIYRTHGPCFNCIDYNSRGVLYRTSVRPPSSLGLLSPCPGVTASVTCASGQSLNTEGRRWSGGPQTNPTRPVWHTAVTRLFARTMKNVSMQQQNRSRKEDREREISERLRDSRLMGSRYTHPLCISECILRIFNDPRVRSAERHFIM